jgi:4-amino-4-deoxy-L-arabinose transferase-like glycosyltransferase
MEEGNMENNEISGFKRIINYEHTPLIALMLMGLALNVYYFNANRAVWWDEAEYLSFGKYFGSGIPYSMSETRAINYPIMLYLFSKIFSGQELILRVLLIIISSCTIGACYFLFKKIFNGIIAFLTTLMFLTNYLYLFFQIRFLTEIPSLMFMLMGLYFFMCEKNKKNNFLTGLFIGLSIATRFTSLLIIPCMIAYQFFKKEKIKNYSWILFLIAGFVPSIIFDLIRNFAPFSEFFLMFSHNQSAAKNNPYYFIDSFARMFGELSVPFFIAGMAIMIARIKKNKSDFLKKNLVFMFFSFHFLFYSFFSAWKEERYMLNIIPFYYCLVSIGILNLINLILDNLNINHKKIIILMVILGIIIPNIQLGNSSILLKSESYKQVKDVAEYAKNEFPSDSKIITNAPPQVSYYAEKETLGLPGELDELYALLEQYNDTNLILISAFEGIPQYFDEFNNAEKFNIIKAGFMGKQSVAYLIQYNRN